MTTLLEGRISTCRLPLFSALYMVFRASPSTLMRTIMGNYVEMSPSAQYLTAAA